MSIRLIICGAKGRMGTVLLDALPSQPDLALQRTIDADEPLEEALQSTPADVVVDLTRPHGLFERINVMIDHRIRPVIGTSGLTPEEVKRLQARCSEQQLGGIIAPNFSLSAVLMMHFAQIAASYFPQAEIIEQHHDQKVDAPSGTAIKTANMITHAANCQLLDPAYPDAAARGDTTHTVPIHSIRLAGLMAHQSVIFGQTGETLTLRQDTTDRQAFMPGLFLACRKVMNLRTMAYGLESLLKL